MRKLLLVVVLALAFPVAASANNGPDHHHHKHHGKWHHHAPAPPETTPAPPVVPPVVIPPAAPQTSAQSFCVTTSRGVTYVELTVGGFNPGTYWRGLYDSGATAQIAGQTVKFINTGNAGIYLAPVKPGVGSTCP